MSTKCLECGNKFTLSEALCEDWRDPSKSFGCPSCGTFYEKDMNINYPMVISGALLGSGIGGSTVRIATLAYGRGDTVTLVFCGVILASLFGVAGLFWASISSKLVKINKVSDS